MVRYNFDRNMCKKRTLHLWYWLCFRSHKVATSYWCQLVTSDSHPSYCCFEFQYTVVLYVKPLKRIRSSYFPRIVPDFMWSTQLHRVPYFKSGCQTMIAPGFQHLGPMKKKKIVLDKQYPTKQRHIHILAQSIHGGRVISNHKNHIIWRVSDR